jgi:P27 family predicted phage terminase small subunit
MIPGQKPKPLEQRTAEGNLEHRPLPEPVMVGGRPSPGELDEPPAWLSEDAKWFWRDSIVRLIDVGIVDRVDVPTLEMLATQYAIARQAVRVLQSEGHYTRGSVGQLRPHPALRIYNEAFDRFTKLAEHYALTPIARTRLGLAELHRRSMKREVEDGLGEVKFEPVLTDADGDEIDQAVDAEVVD